MVWSGFQWCGVDFGGVHDARWWTLGGRRRSVVDGVGSISMFWTAVSGGRCGIDFSGVGSISVVCGAESWWTTFGGGRHSVVDETRWWTQQEVGARWRTIVLFPLPSFLSLGFDNELEWDEKPRGWVEFLIP